MTVYNEIGKGYSIHRKADPRIVESVYRLLDLPGKSLVIDVGAGTGNYSNALADKGLVVYAIEPSKEMRSQATYNPGVSWLQGTAENMPFDDAVADGVIALLSMHHFKSVEKASVEFDRICGNGAMVIFTFDPRQSVQFWLSDYFPGIFNSAYSVFDPVKKVADALAGGKWRYEIIPFPLPGDLSDKFMAFGWKRPEAYLDAAIRNSMSAFALADQTVVNIGINRLKNDLETGTWNEKYGPIKELDEIDLGYRFIKLSR